MERIHYSFTTETMPGINEKIRQKEDEMKRFMTADIMNRLGQYTGNDLHEAELRNDIETVAEIKALRNLAFCHLTAWKSQELMKEYPRLSELEKVAVLLALGRRHASAEAPEIRKFFLEAAGEEESRAAKRAAYFISMWPEPDK